MLVRIATSAPLFIANCIAANPTLPDPPVMRTLVPELHFDWYNIFSAVPYAQGMEANSQSFQFDSTTNTSFSGTLTNSENAPSKSDAIQILCVVSILLIFIQGRTITLFPNRYSLDFDPAKTTSPQQSVPWIRGKLVVPFQPKPF